MSVRNRIRLAYYDNAGLVPGCDITVPYDAGVQVKVDEPFFGSVVTHLVIPTIDVSTLASIVFIATQDVTIYTNADTPGQDDTVTLTANQPRIWSPDVGGTLFLTVDVTDLYVHSTDALPGQLRVVGVQDPTPTPS